MIKCSHAGVMRHSGVLKSRKSACLFILQPNVVIPSLCRGPLSSPFCRRKRHMGGRWAASSPLRWCNSAQLPRSWYFCCTVTAKSAGALVNAISFPLLFRLMQLQRTHFTSCKMTSRNNYNKMFLILNKCHYHCKLSWIHDNYLHKLPLELVSIIA